MEAIVICLTGKIVDDIKKDTEVSYVFQIKHTDKLKFNYLTLCLSWERGIISVSVYKPCNACC